MGDIVQAKIIEAIHNTIRTRFVSPNKTKIRALAKKVSPGISPEDFQRAQAAAASALKRTPLKRAVSTSAKTYEHALLETLLRERAELDSKIRAVQEQDMLSAGPALPPGFVQQIPLPDGIAAPVTSPAAAKSAGATSSSTIATAANSHSYSGGGGGGGGSSSAGGVEGEDGAILSSSLTRAASASSLGAAPAVSTLQLI